MADGHGRVALQEKLCQRSPDDLAASDDAGVRAATRNRVALKQFDDADRRARRERLFSQREATDVDRIEPVNILRRINRLNHTSLINAARQRQLDAHSINVITLIELPYQIKQLSGRRLSRERMMFGSQAHSLRRSH